MASPILHDVLIVGAGPCGLSVAARLLEQTPSAIFTDEEHRRFHWIHKHGHRMSLKMKKSGKISPARHEADDAGLLHPSILVLDDTSNTWMAKWNRLFKTFEISHLRSPMFWHVDPQDRDSLLAFTYQEGRQTELRELKGCVGKELSKHTRKKRMHAKHPSEPLIDERDRHDYFTPSHSLFICHCEKIVERYDLKHKCTTDQARVGNIQFDFMDLFPSETEKLFAVTTDKGAIHYARTVVLAVGAANPPAIPPTVLARVQMHGMSASISPPHMCHSMHITTFPDPLMHAKMRAGRTTNMLVVGGGLTSAQLADLAVRRGVSRVWLITRGPWRTKTFDLDLDWMGKFRNLAHAQFWQLDSDADRLHAIRDARGGGSIPAPYWAILERHVRAGRLVMRDHTKLDTPRAEMVLDETRGGWVVRTDPPLVGEGEGEGEPGAVVMDYVYFATGLQTDCEALPYLTDMQRQYPIQYMGGLPCLTDELAWADGVPLFVTGRLAALRLGPGAANLGGARMGAERIAWQVEKLLAAEQKKRERSGSCNFAAQTQDERMEYVKGHGNRYTVLDRGDGEQA